MERRREGGKVESRADLAEWEQRNVDGWMGTRVLYIRCRLMILHGVLVSMH